MLLRHHANNLGNEIFPRLEEVIEDHRLIDHALETARESLADLIAHRAPRATCAVLVTSSSIEAQPWFDLSTA